MNIEKLSNDVQQIKDDLNKLRESVSSEEEKERMMKEIIDKANATKRELEKEIETLNDEKKEKAQALLDSLNEIINFELSLTIPQGQNTGNWWVSEQQPEWWESENNEGRNRFWRQREWLTSKQEWKDHTWKNILRALWWVWILWWTAWLAKKLFTPKDYESEIPWYSEMSRKEKRLARKELRRQKREERREERAERRTERKESRKQKSFWERPFGKIFKWTIIWTGVYYVSHGLTTWKWNPKDAFDWKKDNPTDSSDNNTPDNNTTDENNSNNNTPDDNNPSEGGSETPIEDDNSTPNQDDNSWEENVESFESINANTISNAAIQTLNQAKSFDKQTNNKVKATLNTYLQEHPMLKKSANGHMVFEIWDKRKFNNTLKQVWNDVLSWLNMIERWLAKALFGWKLDNIDKTMRELKAKEYENVVFKYLWWIVKETVKAENWNMTVQEFYDSVKRYYPNKNASTIERHLAQSGQANKDIKDMDVEKIKNV